MIRILALCGSLRGVSRNRQALLAARKLAPAECEIALWEGLGGLPPFSPDLDQPGLPLPGAVAAFHAEVEQADGLLVACPEYAHGIPGAFKNALDWLVGSSVFPGKPVALINVAPHASFAQAQLREVLATMSAEIVDEACLTVAFPRPEAPGSTHAFEAALRSALDDFVRRLADIRDHGAAGGEGPPAPML
ncbi:NADPH-dependent FMN reductase [Alsobacter sp. KACC 23698]|uniref:NADPH-dependent FMN reductase n=1 Tax=Alsobacter sp. KACC 23698 TaxID=3149229 RepID=A0AAU7JDK9_9HYPH